MSQNRPDLRSKMIKTHVQVWAVGVENSFKGFKKFITKYDKIRQFTIYFLFSGQ